MSSGWKTEILAVIRKELQSELRSKAGLMATGLFSVVTVVAIALSGYNMKISPSLSSGLIFVAMLFASAVSLPRTFLLEEEQGTADLLRLMGRPHAIFWGKALFNLGQMLVTGLVLSLLFVLLASQHVRYWPLFVVSIIGTCGSLAGTVTLCGAIVSQAKNRSALAAALSLPLLLPLVFLVITAMRVPLGFGGIEGGVRGAVGLVLYAAVTLSGGPFLFAAVWKS